MKTKISPITARKTGWPVQISASQVELVVTFQGKRSACRLPSLRERRSTPSVVVPGMQCSRAPADVAKFDQIPKENAFLFIIGSRESRELIGDIFIGTVAADAEENGSK